MDINIDFDGTCTTHDFPRIGKNIGAQRVLKNLVNNGHRLILFTMRSDRYQQSDIQDPTIQNVTGPFLTQAIQWFEDNEIPLYGVQTNPLQHTWTTSPKSYAQLMIDDSALGCPLKRDPSISSRPFVDWDKVENMLYEMKLIY